MLSLHRKAHLSADPARSDPLTDNLYPVTSNLSLQTIFYVFKSISQIFIRINTYLIDVIRKFITY